MSESLPVEIIAEICHEANRVVQRYQADPSIPVSPSWDETDHETQQSAIDGVGYALGGASPQDSHRNWMAFKVEHGWKRGPVKDESKKEHPLLVPYEQLPAAQRVKDKLFTAIVAALT